MSTVLLLDDLDDVGHGVAEADLVRVMAVMVVVRLMMISPNWRRRPAFPPVHNDKVFNASRDIYFCTNATFLPSVTRELS